MRISGQIRTALNRLLVERRTVLATRPPRRWLGSVVPAIACFASLMTSKPSEVCGQRTTLTPAAPPSERSYSLYLKQTSSVNTGRVDLLLIGGSLADGWDNNSLPAAKLVNLGVGGDKVQNVLWRLDSTDWSTIQPGTVLIMFGINNLADDTPCAVVAELKKVVERVKSIWPMAQVVFLDIAPRGKDFLDFDKRRTKVNWAMNKVPGIKTVNVDEELTCNWNKQAVRACPNYAPGNLHFAPAGYAIITKRLH